MLFEHSFKSLSHTMIFHSTYNYLAKCITVQCVLKKTESARAIKVNKQICSECLRYKDDNSQSHE